MKQSKIDVGDRLLILGVSWLEHLDGFYIAAGANPSTLNFLYVFLIITYFSLSVE